MGAMKIQDKDFSKFSSPYNQQTPSWLNLPDKNLSQYTVADYTTGIANLTKFFFQLNKWSIGGMVFDGIMRTEHVHRVRPTQYPVQTGVEMTDHSIIEPAELTIEVMMTDVQKDSALMKVANTIENIGKIYTTAKQLASIKTMNYSNIIQGASAITSLIDDLSRSRSEKAYISLLAMQQSREPITVETRLQTYKNMLIEEISTPDDVKTFHALRCTVRLREIIFAQAAQTQVSARAAATSKESSSGKNTAQPVSNDTLLHAGVKAAKGG